MKTITFLILALAFFNAKSQITPIVKDKIDSNTIDLNIKLNKDTINIFGDLWVTIKVTNKLDKDQKMLFDKTKPGQISPWGIGGVIIYNTETKMTIRANSPAFYSSQAYTDEELKDNYVTLPKKSSISGTFKMTDLASQMSLKSLSKGNYQIQIVYYNVRSNKINLVIN